LAYAKAICRDVIALMKSPLDQGEAIRRLHQETGIEEIDIRAELGHMEASDTGANKWNTSPRNRNTNPEPAQAQDGGNRALAVSERTLLALWARGRISRESLRHAGIESSDFTLEAHRLLFGFLEAHAQQMQGRPFSQYEHLIPQNTVGILAGFLEEEGYEAVPDEYVRDCMRTIRLNRLQKRYQLLAQSLGSSPKEERASKVREMAELHTQIRILQEETR